VKRRERLVRRLTDTMPNYVGVHSADWFERLLSVSAPVGSAERGRQLASEREALIVRGVDPSELVVPLHPDDLANGGPDHEHEVPNEPEWRYGFYDTDPRGDHRYDGTWVPEPQAEPTIYWFVFGLLTHDTAESAEHTARKTVWGQPVIVRRRGDDATEWEHAPGYDHTGRIQAEGADGA